MIANLEGTFSVGGTSKCAGLDSSKCYAFQAPPKNASALTWAGIDLVSLANNHTHDYLAQGMTQTVGTLEANKIAYTGLPDQVSVVDVQGVRVGVVGFSPYPWNASILDIPAAQELVRKAAARVDLVVVLMHAGAEGADQTHTPTGDEVAYGEDRGRTRDFAHAVVDAGADLVLGSGPHVVRGIERYHDRLIAYSLGNFAGWHNFSRGSPVPLRVAHRAHRHEGEAARRALALVAAGRTRRPPGRLGGHLCETRASTLGRGLPRHLRHGRQREHLRRVIGRGAWTARVGGAAAGDGAYVAGVPGGASSANAKGRPCPG